MRDTKCDKCGDESNSEPNLPCGRSLGVDAHGEETLPPYCDGTYRLRRLATIITRDVSAPGRKPIIRPFYLDETGIGWAVPREHERAALMFVGSSVEIEIRCLDDQFAYPVSR